LGLFRSVGARHTDNVVLTDEGPLWATFITNSVVAAYRQ